MPLTDRPVDALLRRNFGDLLSRFEVQGMEHRLLVGFEPLLKHDDAPIAGDVAQVPTDWQGLDAAGLETDPEVHGPILGPRPGGAKAARDLQDRSADVRRDVGLNLGAGQAGSGQFRHRAAAGVDQKGGASPRLEEHPEGSPTSAHVTTFAYLSPGYDASLVGAAPSTSESAKSAPSRRRNMIRWSRATNTSSHVPRSRGEEACAVRIGGAGADSGIDWARAHSQMAKTRARTRAS